MTPSLIVVNMTVKKRKKITFFQDALTDLTGDSERLPVEEQHGNWLGHKVRGYCLKVLMYNRHILLHCTLSSETFHLRSFIAQFQQVTLSWTPNITVAV